MSSVKTGLAVFSRFFRLAPIRVLNGAAKSRRTTLSVHGRHSLFNGVVLADLANPAPVTKSWSPNGAYLTENHHPIQFLNLIATIPSKCFAYLSSKRLLSQAASLIFLLAVFFFFRFGSYVSPDFHSAHKSTASFLATATLAFFLAVLPPLAAILIPKSRKSQSSPKGPRTK